MEINKMDNFRLFLENEEEKDVKAFISKLPPKHQKLLNGFKFRFTPGNTLKGDNEHIGYIHKDRIVVAAPFHYSRSLVVGHESGHLIFEKLMTPQLKKEWSALIKRTIKDQIKSQPKQNQSALKQNDEEIFCMVYASTYVKHPPSTYLNPEWQDFITKKVPH